MSDQKKMAKTAYLALDEKKGEDIQVIDISSISIMADYFIISNGGSMPQVRAMAENVQEKMLENGFHLKRMEGGRESSWMLLDYGDIVVHIFDRDDRSFYNLERIWSDGITVDVETL